jgi:hypothetical protein
MPAQEFGGKRAGCGNEHKRSTFWTFDVFRVFRLRSRFSRCRFSNWRQPKPMGTFAPTAIIVATSRLWGQTAFLKRY